MKGKLKQKKVLFHYMRGASAGGSDTCLYFLLKNLNQSKYEPYLLYRDSSNLVEELRELNINLIQLPDKIRKSYYIHLEKSAEISSQNPKKTKTIKKLYLKSGKVGILLNDLKYIIKKIPEIIQFALIIYRNKIDIIHTNHDISSDNTMVYASMLLKKKIVSHNRGLYIPRLVDIYLSKYIDEIICMSDFSKSVYVENGVSEKKCKTIYDGIDIKKFTSTKNDEQNLTIGCIGRIEEWKGQQVLVDAAEIIVKTIPEIKFMLIGTGDYENVIRAKVKEKGLDNNFEFTGHVTNVKDYIEKCTIIVHTSIVPEPFGMVILEAMALEKLVIATNFGGPVEIINNEEDGFLIPAENPQILAEYIMKLAKDPVLREKIKKKAREKVVAKFDDRVYTKQIEHVYDEICK